MKNDILIIEDNQSVREEISDILEMEGFNIRVSENGKIGLKSVNKNKPNLILTDIVMPEMGGFELYQNIKKNPETKNIPIIFLSARADKESLEKAKSLGCLDYVVKPVSSELLVEKINSKLNYLK